MLLKTSTSRVIGDKNVQKKKHTLQTGGFTAIFRRIFFFTIHFFIHLNNEIFLLTKITTFDGLNFTDLQIQIWKSNYCMQFTSVGKTMDTYSGSI
jgi:hypothetical protein